MIPVVKLPPDCVFCKLAPGELTIARAPNGKATAVRVACPDCGYPDIVDVFFSERVMVQSRRESVDRLTPGWQCGSPLCRKWICIVGGRFVVGPSQET